MIPAILTPIDNPPEFEDGTGDRSMFQEFIALSRLFVYLEGDFTTVGSSKSPLDSQKIVTYQTNLSLIPDNKEFREAQRVDLCVTRQWVRLLLWEYTARHFPMTSSPADEAFSLLLPVQINHELLSMFSAVTSDAIKSHGYGMVSVNHCDLQE